MAMSSSSAEPSGAGKIAWRSQERGLSAYSHPILADIQGKEKQVIILAAPGLVAMEPKTGKTIWRFAWQTEYDVNASDPIYRDGYLFITSGYDHGAMVLDLTGKAVKKSWELSEIGRAHV